jgi:hypothetical protein
VCPVFVDYCNHFVPQPQQHDAGKGVQFGKAEAGPASVDHNLNIFGNLAHKPSVMI